MASFALTLSFVENMVEAECLLPIALNLENQWLAHLVLPLYGPVVA